MRAQAHLTTFWNYNTIIDTESIDESSLLELKNVQDDHDEPEG
jgi:hypothetical protein